MKPNTKDCNFSFECNWWRSNEPKQVVGQVWRQILQCLPLKANLVLFGKLYVIY